MKNKNKKKFLQIIFLKWRAILSIGVLCMGVGVLTLSAFFSHQPSQLGSAGHASNYNLQQSYSEEMGLDIFSETNLQQVFSASINVVRAQQVGGYENIYKETIYGSYGATAYKEKEPVINEGAYNEQVTAAMPYAQVNGCNAVDAQKKLSVVTTTTIVADLLRQIGGSEVCVTSLMGVGIDPHSYIAREGDVRRLLQADVIFYHGVHLEAKMAEILESINIGVEKKVYNLAQYVPKSWLIPVNSNGELEEVTYYDPHIWFDVRIWKKVAETASLALQMQHPQQKYYFSARTKAYIQRLAGLHFKVQQTLQGLPQKVLITSHDAFSYFGRAYGVKVLSLKGINTQMQSGIKDMQNLVDFIVAKNIPAIFTENSMSKKEINTVAMAVRAKGHSLKVGSPLFTDALGSLKEGANTYETMFLQNVKFMNEHLGSSNFNLKEANSTSVGNSQTKI